VGHRPGDRPPYATAALILSLADQPHLKAYVSGKLVLGRVDSRVSAAVWWDALYAIVVDAPHEQLEKLYDQIVLKSHQLRPDRATWGLLPDQVAMTNKIVGKDLGNVPKVTKR
jgi:hypothetical protein